MEYSAHSRRSPELPSKTVSLHQAGNLHEAEALYHTILSSDFPSIPLSPETLTP
jgi:hypothetical protein